MGRRGRVSGWIVLCALLAGCAGEAKPSTSSGSEAPTLTDDDLGIVSGTVVDEEIRPIQGAEVTVADADLKSVFTDPDGFFRIPNVPVGTQEILASKAGYEPGRRPVIVTASEEVMDVQVTLVQFVSPDQGTYDSFAGQAFIACGVNNAHAGFTYSNPCASVPDHHPDFDFTVWPEQGLTAIQVEAAWVPTLPLSSDQLRVQVWKDVSCAGFQCTTQSTLGAGVNGPSPLKGTWGGLTTPINVGAQGAGAVVLSAIALHRHHGSMENEPGGGLTFNFQQPVDFYVTVFYKMNVPAGSAAAPQ